MSRAYGPQHWWPGETPFEIIIGAILTQSAAWTNVEKAIRNLKSADALSPMKIRDLPLEKLAELIRPCGYYNAKAVKLKTFISWLDRHYSSGLDAFFTIDISLMREQLLSIRGIGEETADSIILYAAAKPIFVVDAYTRRIISRIGLLPDKERYNTYQAFFMENLPADTKQYNEYHALLVKLGKLACRKIPVCADCCLNDMCLEIVHLNSVR